MIQQHRLARVYRDLRLASAIFAGSAACSSPANKRVADADTSRLAPPVSGQIVVDDDTGHPVILRAPANRIISLVPSGTEVLVALGAARSLVGRTMYDTEPELARIPSVGGGLNPNAETMIGLAPDLLITWAGTKNDPVREQLASSGAAIYGMRTRDTGDVFQSITRLAHLTGRDSAGHALALRIRAELNAVRRSVAGRATPSVLFILWGDPPMTAGPNTFIAQLISLAGGRSLFPDVDKDWAQVSVEEIVRRSPEYLVLPVGEDRNVARLRSAPGWRDLPAVKAGRIIEIPADLMNRPGPNIAEAARRLRDGIHPELRRPSPGGVR